MSSQRNAEKKQWIKFVINKLTKVLEMLQIAMNITIIKAIKNEHLEDNLKLVSLPNNCQLHCSRFISRQRCVDVTNLDLRNFQEMLNVDIITKLTLLDSGLSLSTSFVLSMSI